MIRQINADSERFQTETAGMKQQYELELAGAESEAHTAEARAAGAESRAEELAAALQAAEESVRVLTAEGATAQQAIGDLARNYSNLEAEFESVRTENAQLVEQIAKRTEKDHQRTSRILDLEREQHEEMVRSIQARFNGDIEKLSDTVKRKSDRCDRLKRKIEDVTNDFTNALDVEKKTSQSLRQKHQKEMSAKSALVTALTAQLKGLQAQNEDLQHMVDGFGEQLARTEEARDQALRVRIEELEEQLQKREAPAPTKPQIQPDRKPLERLAEWENWARRTYSNVMQGAIFKESSKVLRLRLGEMIIASLDQWPLMAKVRSLRDQKALLLTGKVRDNVADETPTLWTVVVIGLSLTRMRHNFTVRSK
jgi:chromosome segregation ATPase